MIGEDDDVGGAGRAADAVALVDAEGERLLAEHVDPLRGGLDRELAVQRGRRRDVHEVEPLVGEELVDRRVAAHVRQQLGGDRELRLVGVTDGEDRKVAVVLPHGNVTVNGHVPEADEGAAERAVAADRHVARTSTATAANTSSRIARPASACSCVIVSGGLMRTRGK